VKRVALCLGTWLMVGTAFAIDHNNLDAGRPLNFEDAYSIGFGERVFESGFGVTTGRRMRPGYALDLEFKNGFAMNRDIGIGLTTGLAGRDRRISVDGIELSYFHGIMRETTRHPGIGHRIDVHVPTNGDEGVDLLFRGVVTQSVGQFDKLHLNGDVELHTSAPAGTRDTVFGLTLGYSRPLGYPRRFDQTLLASVGWRQDPDENESSYFEVGVGLRQQMTPRSVFDIGLVSRLGRSPSHQVRVGYSYAF